jgi:predicted dehydrogenase
VISNRPVRVGIVGAGNITGHHLVGYRQTTDVAKVAAIADVDIERAKQIAEPLGAHPYADYNDMIDEADIDAVDICLPHHLHKEAIVRAAAAGKHILCEKPLCVSLDEADAVTDAVQRAGVTLMCAHNQLFLPTIKRAKEMIQEGKLGKVFGARTTDMFVLKVDAGRIGWRGRKATSGGGELIDTGYHPTYLLLHLVASEPTEVLAMLSKHRLTFLEGEDTAHVLVRFADGTTGSILTGWAYEPPGSTERFSVAGDEGSIWSDGRSLFYKPTGGATTVVQEADAQEPDTYAMEVVDFIACLREGRRPLNTEVEGVKVLKVILGAYESAERGAIAHL